MASAQGRNSSISNFVWKRHYKAILAFNTAANGIAISVQEDADMPAIYWLEELDETTLEPIIQSVRPQNKTNVYAMDIGIAGHQRIIATDNSQAIKTNGKQIADMMTDFCKVISNANKAWLKSGNRILECGELTSYGEQNGCHVGICGACVVLIDGKPMRACRRQPPASRMRRRRIGELAGRIEPQGRAFSTSQGEIARAFSKPSNTGRVI